MPTRPGGRHDYIRMHTGFCRQITVTPADLEARQVTGPAATAVHVELGPRSYDIQVGTGNLAKSVASSSPLRRRVSHAVVITDECGRRAARPEAVASLSAAGVAVDVLVVAQRRSDQIGRRRPPTCGTRLLELGVDRRALVVAVGGGVVGDLAGFVAADVRPRAGLRAGAHHAAGPGRQLGGRQDGRQSARRQEHGRRFLAAARRAGSTRACWPRCPTANIASGLAEVVKYGVILDAELFAYLERHTAELAARDATRAGTRDPALLPAEGRRGRGRRAGRDRRPGRAELRPHVRPRAWRPSAGYGALLHGEAVAIGMVRAARLSERRLPV